MEATLDATDNLNILRPRSLGAFGAALRRQRQARGLTLDALATATGISKPYLSNIETGRTPGPPSAEKLERMAGALRLDPGDLSAAADWLRTPESVRQTLERQSVMRPANEPPAKPGADTEHGAPSSKLSLRQVPLINQVAAGKPAAFTDLDYPVDIADQYVAVPDLPDAPASAAFAVRVQGESMLPEYREGEILIVGPVDEARQASAASRTGADQPADPIDGRDCIVRLGALDDYATTFKRVHVVRDDAGEPVALRLVPLNRKFPVREVRLDQITGIYPLLYRLVPPPPPAAANSPPSTKSPAKSRAKRAATVPAASARPPTAPSTRESPRAGDDWISEPTPEAFTTMRASMESD